MKTFLSSPTARRGSALVLVLWCLMVLSLAVFAVVAMVELSVDHASFEHSQIEAQNLAASGAAVGQVPQLLADDPLLQQTTDDRHGFHVTISSEAGRFNLNFLLLTNHRDVLITLFTKWGMKNEDAQHAAACLYDWVTPGDLPSLNGAKAAAYEAAGLPQRPTAKPFTTWAEVNEVMGVDAIAAVRPDWQDSFTLWTDGPLDLNAAPGDRMAALFGVDEERVESLVKLRNGRDGVAETSDDTPLTPALVQAQMGLSDLQMKALQREFYFGSDVRRIESTGQYGDARASITIITRLKTTPPQFFVWSER